MNKEQLEIGFHANARRLGKCVEATKLGKERKKHDATNASLRYAYVLAYLHTRERRVLFPFWSPKASCSVTKYVDGIDT